MKAIQLFGTTLVLSALVLLSGCINPFDGRGKTGDESGRGTVRVTVASLRTSSVVPDLSGLVASYTVTLRRSGFSDTTLSGDQTAFEFPDIAPGDWEIIIEATDDDGLVIGKGNETVAVSESGVASVSVSIAPTSVGTGAIDITVTWPSGLANEVGVSTIAPVGGQPAGINGSITGLPDQARYVAGHDAGVYELAILIGKDGVRVAAVVVAVHVYDNVVTKETIALSEGEIGQAPAAPTDLSAAAGDHQVTLSWTDVSRVNDHYEIQRRIDGTSTWQDIDPPLGAATTEYVDTSVFGGTTYNYRIRATNSFGPILTGEGWVQFNAVTPSTPQLAPPTLTAPDPFVPGGKILLSTNKPDNVRYYYTKDGATTPSFNPETFEPGTNTFAVWQYEGIVLDTAGVHEVRVLARADGWLTSGITTQTFTVEAGQLVTNANKTGPGSLSSAISNATDGETIAFAGDYEIYLGAPSAFDYGINKNLIIDGGNRNVTIDGGLGARHFTLASNVDVTIRNLRLWRGSEYNPSLDDGGSIYVNPGATLTVENVHFDSNGSAPAGSHTMSGGAIYNDGGTVTVKKTLFEANRINMSGGAIANANDGTVTIRDSVFVGNWTSTDGTLQGGGAVWAASGTNTTIIKSLFAENRADSVSGGTIRVDGGAITVHGSLFAENQASAGAVFDVNGSASLTVSNSVFADNDISQSPLFSSKVLTLDLSSASALFVGSSFVNQNLLATSITNSAFDADSSWMDGFSNPAISIPTYSLGPGLSQTTNIDGAAQFVREPGRGPDGEWGTADDDWGDMRLVSGSPGINSGSNGAVPADAKDVDEDGNTGEDEADYAGNMRIQGGTVDIGAVER